MWQPSFLFGSSSIIVRPFFSIVWALRGASKVYIGNFQTSKFNIFTNYPISSSTSLDTFQVFAGSNWNGEWLWQFCQPHPQSFLLRAVGTFVDSAFFARCPKKGARDGAILEATTSSACQEPADHTASRADVARHMLSNASSTVCETPKHLFQP